MGKRLLLEQASGEASLNLLRLARESLVYPLRRAVDTAFAHNQVVHEPGVQVQHAGETRQIRLSVIPISDHTRIGLVLFEQESRVTDAVPPRDRVGEPSALELQLSQTQRELAQARDYLRKIIEQHEATTEELRAANEEAQSSNEELQSTNEELRTAKEELQSSNEELTTVNDELKHRYQELEPGDQRSQQYPERCNHSRRDGGDEFRLRRFTPAAERLLGLAPADIGRPIADLHLTFHLPLVKEILTETIQTLGVQQRRAQDKEGRWYNVFFRPYRTVDEESTAP